MPSGARSAPSKDALALQLRRFAQDEPFILSGARSAQSKDALALQLRRSAQDEPFILSGARGAQSKDATGINGGAHVADPTRPPQSGPHPDDVADDHRARRGVA